MSTSIAVSTGCQSPLRGFPDAQLDAQAGGRRHVHQGVQAEQADFSSHQVRDARLRDAEPLGGLRLCEVGMFDVRCQRHYEHRAQIHVFLLRITTNSSARFLRPLECFVGH